jgi:hypothetical protein
MANVGAFAEDTFTLRGDPAAIDASADTWARFAADADNTATDLRRLDATDFQGDEADTYRARLNTDLPPYLDTTARAWTQVGTALRTYAATLAQLQTQISGLRCTAWSQWQSAAAADTAADQAEADDNAHTADRHQRAETLEPGQPLPTDTYQPAAPDARSTAATTNAAYNATMTAADQLHADHSQAMNACADAIDRATAMRFADPPSWLGHLWHKACDWVADHIDILQTLSAVLKQISSIAATLAMIPILAPLAGPVAAGTGALALGIDTGIKITTGKGNWTDIALTGMSLIPGAKAATATDLLTTTNDAINGNLDFTQLATTAALGAAGRRHGDPGEPARTRSEPNRESISEIPASREADPRPDPDLTPPEPSDTYNACEESADDGDVTALAATGVPTAQPAQFAPLDDPRLGELLRKRRQLPADRQHLLDFNPDLSGIPQTWLPRVADNGNGWIWQHPDTIGTRGLQFRVAGPVEGRHPYPNGYVRLTRADGQYLGQNGRASQPLVDSHVGRRADGTYAFPEGWRSVVD